MKKVVALFTALAICLGSAMASAVPPQGPWTNDKIVAFVKSDLLGPIISIARATGVWPSLVIGQMLTEQGGNSFDYAYRTKNPLGLKYSSYYAHFGSNGSSLDATQEHGKGTKDTFTTYESFQAAFLSHANLWFGDPYAKYEGEGRCYKVEGFGNPRIPPEVLLDLKGGTAKEMYRSAAASPYHTGKNNDCSGKKPYISNIEMYVTQYDLTQYDRMAFPNGRKCAGGVAPGTKRVGTCDYPDDGYSKLAKMMPKDGKSVDKWLDWPDLGGQSSLPKVGTGTDGGTKMIGGMELPGELELLGMPKLRSLAEKDVEQLDPTRGLTVAESKQVADIGQELELRNAGSIVGWLRTCVAFLGLLALVWSLLILAAYLFDKWNVLFNLNLLQLVTLGGAKTQIDKDTKEKRSADLPKVIRLSLVMFLVAFLLLTGSVYGWLIWVFDLVRGWVYTF